MDTQVKWFRFLISTICIWTLCLKSIYCQHPPYGSPYYGPVERYVDFYPKIFPYRAAQGYTPPNIHPDLLHETYSEVEATMKSKDTLENRIVTNGDYVPLEILSATARHNAHYIAKPKFLFAVETFQDHIEALTKRIQNKLNLANEEVFYGLPKFSLYGLRERLPALDTCHQVKEVYCKESRYRTADGTCNNPNSPTWGQAFACFQRILAPDYSDGVSEIRTSIDGSPLPNPRVISNQLHYHVHKYNTLTTHMLMQWGQLVDHDVTFTQSYLAATSFVLDCCKPSGPYNKTYAGQPTSPNPEYFYLSHPRCLPIIIPPDDPFFPQVGVHCLNFVRSASCLSCSLGARLQTNQVTSFLDASGTYGSSTEEQNSLRDPNDYAKMAVSQSRYGPLLPRSRNPSQDQCSSPNPAEFSCFTAGDVRVNQHPGVSTLSTIFVRHHNHMVDRMRATNPHWSDELLFQEVRRIVIAQVQMISFREYIHLVIGPTMMTFFDLWPQETGFTEYSPAVNPTLLSEFSTAAYRYGHSLVNRNFFEILGGGQTSGFELKDNYFNPMPLHNGSLDSILLGLSNQPAQMCDQHIVPDLTRYVYKTADQNSGLDLVSLNIYRGRDHGMKGYVAYLKYCYDFEILQFEDLAIVMSEDNINRLRSVYNYVQDIDLWTGALHEYRLKEAVVGPTFGCIIGLQYYFMKLGDRYYFEHGKQPGSFTEGQLYEIRKTWLSKIICSSADFISQMQLDVFQPVQKGNEYFDCDDIPDIDLTHWKDNSRYT